MGTRATVLILVLVSFAYAVIGVSGALGAWLPEPALTYLFVAVLACMAMLLPRVASLTRPIQRYFQSKRAASSGGAR